MIALREMIRAARDSAALHELRGEHAEAARWSELAERWEARVVAMSTEKKS